MSKPEMLHEKPGFVNDLNKAVHLCEMLVKAAALRHDGVVERMAMITACASAPLMAMATTIAAGGEKDFKLTPDHGLMAALMFSQMVNIVDKSTHSVEYNVEMVLNAMNDFEKLTGRKPDDLLAPPMVKAARELEGSGGDLLDTFMAGRKQ